MSAWHRSQNCIICFAFNHVIKNEFTGVLHNNEVTKCLFATLEPRYTGIHKVNDIGCGGMQVKIVLEVIVPVTVIED